MPVAGFTGLPPLPLMCCSVHAVPVCMLVPARSGSRLHQHPHHTHLRCRLYLRPPGQSLAHTCSYPDGENSSESCPGHLPQSKSISDLKTECDCLAWLVAVLFAPFEMQLL